MTYEGTAASLEERYSTERLQETIDRGNHSFPGPANRARHLLLLDTPARRKRADWEGHALTNILGGRPSDNVHTAVLDLQRLIASGREEDGELYGERVARQDRERQQAVRDAQLAAAKLRTGALR